MSILYKLDRESLLFPFFWPCTFFLFSFCHLYITAGFSFLFFRSCGIMGTCMEWEHRETVFFFFFLHTHEFQHSSPSAASMVFSYIDLLRLPSSCDLPTHRIVKVRQYLLKRAGSHKRSFPASPSQIFRGPGSQSPPRISSLPTLFPP